MCSDPLAISPLLPLAPYSGSIQRSSGPAQAASCSFSALWESQEGICVVLHPPAPLAPVSSLHPAFVGSQAESKQVGQSIFRRSLLNRLQQEYKDREELRTRSLQAWICYVTFICNIFDYLRVRSWSTSSPACSARRAWASQDTRAGMLGGCCTDPQGHGGQSWFSAQGCCQGWCYLQAWRGSLQEQSRSLSFLILYLVFEIS